VTSNTTNSGVPGKEQLFELIVESSTDFAIFTTDADGATTSWNRGAERLFGYAERDILGLSADVIFTAEDRQAGEPEKERREALTKGRAIDERWHQRKDGSRFWASGLMMPLISEGGGYVKISRDRTEQHQAEQRVRDNEERFRLLATSIPQLVFRTMPDGSRTWGSPQWIEYTGLSLAESVGFGWMDAIHPEDREATHEGWRNALAQGEYHVEHRIRRHPDGEYRWHQTRAKPIERETASAGDWVGTMTDIHDLRGLKDRQGMLMAELQHRTRNLLAVVQSIARKTIRSSTSLEVFGIEFEDRLRALSRVQSLLARVDDHVLDLHALVSAELAAHQLQDMKADKIVIAGPAILLPAMSAQAMGLALHELATNAVKYGALAQPTGQLTIEWGVEYHGSVPTVALDWRESGVAMPQPVAAHRKGYGSELIERALPYQLQAKTKLEFGKDGVHCSIVVPIPASKSVEMLRG
jgi:PAS domain S-box-containing protein